MENTVLPLRNKASAEVYFAIATADDQRLVTLHVKAPEVGAVFASATTEQARALGCALIVAADELERFNKSFNKRSP